MAHPTSDTSTELTDSLLHTNVPRIILGIICGMASGAIMLGLTMLCPPVGLERMWWIQFASTIFYGGTAMDFAISTKVLLTGLGVHFFFCCLCGLIMGKITRSEDPVKMAIYGLVLGGLCWLATNMWGPNFLDWNTLKNLGQWYRGILYVTFTMSMGVFIAIASRALPK